MCRERSRLHIFKRGVKGNIQSTHLSDRCSGKLPEYTSLEQRYRYKHPERIRIIRKDNVAREWWSFSWTCLQTVFSSTVLGEKASEVGRPRGAASNFTDVVHQTGQQQHRKRTRICMHQIWWVWGFALRLFLECECVNGHECVGECMTSQWPSSAQTLDCGERCRGPDLQCPRWRHHHAPHTRVTRSQPGEPLKQGRIDGHCVGE